MALFRFKHWEFLAMAFFFGEVTGDESDVAPLDRCRSRLFMIWVQPQEHQNLVILEVMPTATPNSSKPQSCNPVQISQHVFS